ncbi:MAG: signal peptidase I, partial [Candidatus Arcticimaribacter sp.]
HSVYKAKGVSGRKLYQEGFKDFTRKYRIENITQERYDAILPYIHGIYSNDLDNFVVISPAAGIPVNIVNKQRLKMSELLEAKKDLLLTVAEAEQLKTKGGFDSIVRQVNGSKTANTSFFPNSLPYDWNEDNFGPIVLPKAGVTIDLTAQNLPLYKKIIREYEGNQLSKKEGAIIINGKESTQYTFQQDYYWMMGDNRHRSEDSRYWGFVPEDHIVGKPVLIWFSIEGINDGIRNWSIRWDRVMTTVKGEGKAFAFGPYVFGLILIWQVIVFILRRKKAQSA